MLYARIFCIYLYLSAAGQTADDPSALASVIGQVDGIGSSAVGVSRTANRLSVSFYSLVAWVALATVALVAVTAVMLQRRREQRRIRRGDSDDDGGDSMVDHDEDYDERSPTIVCEDSVATETEGPCVTTVRTSSNAASIGISDATFAETMTTPPSALSLSD